MPEPVEQPLRIEQRPGERVLALEGELDMAETVALVDAAAPLAAGSGDLTLDLSGLTFIDSSGLLALLRTAEQMADGGSSCCARPNRCARSSTWSSSRPCRRGSPSPTETSAAVGVCPAGYRRPMAKLSARERAELPDRAFAYIDSNGVRRLPINDEAHVRNALARFDRVAWEDDDARDRARQRLLNAAKRFGIMPVGFINRQLGSSRRPSLPTGSVTFLLTDIEGSTALLRQLGDDYAGLLRDVRACTKKAVAGAGGHPVDSHGDEFFAVFERPDAAVQAAIDLFAELRGWSWPGGVDVLVRAGIHGGRPTLTDTGYVGISVHTVARICSVAHGGQIVVSSHAVEGATPPGVRYRSLGEHRLAGLAKAEALYQVHADGLRTKFPPLRISPV